MMNFALKTRNCVSKVEESCIENDEFCRDGHAVAEQPVRKRMMNFVL